MVAEGELPRKPRARCITDPADNSVHYIVNEEKYPTPTGLSPSLNVWWNRDPKKIVGGRTVRNERLVLRQLNRENEADVIMITLGQLYDLIDALNRAVENR